MLRGLQCKQGMRSEKEELQAGWYYAPPVPFNTTLREGM
jgi:hypothetical protein